MHRLADVDLKSLAVALDLASERASQITGRLHSEQYFEDIVYVTRAVASLADLLNRIDQYRRDVRHIRP